MKLKKRNYSIIFTTLISCILVLIINNIFQINQPAIAQNSRPSDVAQQAYQNLENFPLENQYISQETGENNIDHTLILRLIRYHQYVKRRAVIYRFDWKLTLADYLDANEVMRESQYPGRTVLTENPLSSDRQIIQSLTRQQRDELIAVLVNIYNPQNSTSESINSPENNNQNTPSRPNLPSSGAADLLRF